MFCLDQQFVALYRWVIKGEKKGVFDDASAANEDSNSVRNVPLLPRIEVALLLYTQGVPGLHPLSSHRGGALQKCDGAEDRYLVIRCNLELEEKCLNHREQGDFLVTNLCLKKMMKIIVPVIIEKYA